MHIAKTGTWSGAFWWLTAIAPDGRLLLATSSVRAFAYGLLSVVLGLSLAARGFSSTQIGILFAVALAGGAMMTMIMTTLADRHGRRRMLLVAAVLMAVAGVVFTLSDQPLLLALAALIGTVSPSGKEIGPFLPIEQAILPQTTTAPRRTSLFAAYSLVGSLAGALGALGAGIPSLLGVPAMAGYRAVTVGYVAAAVVTLALFTCLSPTVEAVVQRGGPRRRLGLDRSAGIVAKLSALFALDSFAGALVLQGLIAYWFHLRYGTSTTALAALLFGVNLCGALSFLAAPAIARRFGLLNTMVFTHLPSNVLLLLVPLVPSASVAVAVLLVRALLSQMDVPTRQSYVMAIVDPNERSAAAGVTAVARTAAAALAPALAGAMLAVPAAGIPFLCAGSLKIIYDLAIFTIFRSVHPPEETARAH